VDGSLHKAMVRLTHCLILKTDRWFSGQVPEYLSLTLVSSSF